MHVNGSFIQNAFWVLRLPHTGRILRVGFLGYNPHHATVQSEETEPYQVSENGAAAEEEGITLSFSTGWAEAVPAPPGQAVTS